MKMKGMDLLWVFFLMSTAVVPAVSQIEVTAAGTGVLTPENLVTNVFLGQGVEVTNLQYQGSDQAVGYFTNGLSDIGIDRGIIMSSGLAVTAASENGAGNTTGTTSGTSVTDPDLAQIANAGIQDVAVYSISFIPINDTLRFKFAFASEEYPEWACSNFNDAFGFFISGPGISGPFSNNGANIALVPDPSDPTGQTFTNVPVTINNVNDQGIDVAGGCNFDYGIYYNDNTGSPTLTYDGYLDVFTAQALVIPCQEYTIKLAICDRGDQLFDSAVFLEAKSFGTGALKTDILTTSLDFSVAEGCDNGFFEISLPGAADENLTLDYTIFGDATPGLDYEPIPSDLIIPAGDSGIVIPVIAFEDSLQEGPEQVCLDIQLDPCNRDTFCITIREKLIVKPDLGLDTSICIGSAVPLDASLDIPLPAPATFYNEDELFISPVDVALFSDIDVSGVLPGILQEGVIKQVCLDTIIHPWLDDLDIYLISPGGQFVELTTDNGANGDNYIGTCFTLGASLPINAPGPFAPADSTPFTGDHLPEGVWEDLWDGDNPTNGTWRLQIVDDANGFTGTLKQWSICFEPIYQLTYEWESAPGLSCYDCPDPVAQPDSTTTYVVRVTDSYGCETRDTIVISINNDAQPVIDSIVVSPASCLGVDDGAISIFSEGPNPPLTFSLSGEAPQATGEFDSLAAGQYQVVVSGSTGCAVFQDVAVEPADTLFLDLSLSQPVSCDSGSDGVVQAVASGGAPVYAYLWEDGSTADTLSGIGQGVYSLTVTDANGCVAEDSIDVPQPGPITLLFSVSNVTCFETATGAITAVPTGGSGGYQFTWDIAAGGQQTATASGLTAGTYTVTVTDTNGCSVVRSATVEEASSALIVLNAVNVSCAGRTDGLASATALGGAGGFTYLWSNGNSGSLQTSLAAGTYVVTATDVNGCEVVDSVALIQPDSLIVIDVVIDSTACANSADGSLSFAVSGGTPALPPAQAYSYFWSDGGTPEAMRTGLQAGSYTVTVTDARGCQTEASFLVGSPDSIALMVNILDASCSGIADGQAVAIAGGGSPGYQFEWSTGLTGSDTIAELEPGGYAVTVTDGEGCTAETGFQVSSPATLVPELILQNVSCHGGADGFASLSVSGGSPPYTINWSTGQTGPNSGPLGAGDWSVIVTDQQGCQIDSAFSISQPPPLGLTLLPAAVSCQGGSNGSLEAVVSGGTPPIVASWSNGVSNSNTINSLTAGFYAVTLSDGNGCTFTDGVQITEPDILEVQLVEQEDVRCFEGSDGRLEVDGTGGTLPYTFAWSGGLSDGPVQDALNAGSYTLTLSDANGCETIETFALTEPPELLVPSADVIMVGCFGDLTGGISPVVEGGVQPYVFIWSSGQTDATISGVPAGGYGVTVTDANSCTTISTFEVTQPEALSIGLEVTDVECFGENTGSIDATISGGTEPYDVVWTQNTVFLSGLEDLASLEAGNYVVAITDANGCTVSGAAEVQQPNEPLTVQLSIPDTLCAGATNGTVVAAAVGGTGPYLYSWSDGQTGSQASGLGGGSIEVTVTDSKQCVVSGSVEVPSYGVLTAELSGMDPSCAGGTDGSVDVIGVFYDGTPAPASAFSYTWNTLPPQSGPVATSLVGGQSWQVTVTNVAGCSVVASRFLEDPEPVVMTVSNVINATCNGGADGSATVMASGGTGSFTWQWDAAAGGQTEATASGLGPGVYTVTATDGNGCTAVAGVTIDEPSTLNITDWEVTDVGCFGDADGSLQAFVEGGNPPYTASWSNGGSGLEINGLEAGTFTITITDQSGCTLTASQEVAQPEDRMLPVAEWEDLRCFGSQDGSIRLTVEGGTGPYLFSLNGRDYSSNPIFLNLGPGLYTQLSVRDANGCEAVADSVRIFEPDPLSVDLGDDQTILYGDSIQLLPVIEHAQGALQFSWVTNDSLRCEAGSSPCLEPWVSPEYRGEYQLIIIDSNGCQASDFLIVDVELEKGFYVPTGFTPNGDGLNDLLRTHGRSDIEVVVFRVYDRWGELVYEQGGFRADEGIGWDGTFRGREMPTGLYVWYAEVEFRNGRRELFQGESQMIR